MNGKESKSSLSASPVAASTNTNESCLKDSRSDEPAKIVIDLWVEAAKKINANQNGDTDDLHIDLSRADRIQVIDDVFTIAKNKETEFLGKQTRIHGYPVREFYAKIVESINRFKQVGDIVSQIDPGHAALPWAGISLFLNVVTEGHEVYTAFLQGMTQVSMVIAYNRRIEKLYLGSGAEDVGKLQESLVSLYSSVLVFIEKAYRYYTSSSIKRGVKNVLGSRSKGVKEMYTKIEDDQKKVDQWLNLAGHRAQADQGGRLAHQNNMLSGMHENILKLVGFMEYQQSKDGQKYSIADDLDHAEYVDGMEWLSTIAYDAYHQEVRKDRLQGTGKWVFRKPEYTRWMDSSGSSVLWLNGTRGMGKTKLISSIIDHFLEDGVDGQDASYFAYFYCRRVESHSEWSNPNEVFRSLLKQLLFHAPGEKRSQIYDMYQQRKASLSNIRHLSVTDCVNVTVDLLQNTPATIIIDALDEVAPGRYHDLVNGVRGIVNNSKQRVKILICSRNNLEIDHTVLGVENCYLSAADNKEDIEAFIQHEVNQRKEDGRLPNSELCDDIVQILEERAQGMFQWVVIQLEQIPNNQTDVLISEDIRKKLAESAQDLDDGYAATYSDIQTYQETRFRITRNTFQWLLASRKRLQETAFISAVAVDADGKPQQIASNDILKLCRSMVSFEASHRHFSFFHLSVVEFLGKLDDYCPSLSHKTIADRCFDALDAAFKLASNKPRPHADLIEYAALFWPLHYQRVKIEDRDPALKKKLLDFVLRSRAPSSQFKKWLGSLETRILSLAKGEESLRKNFETLMQSRNNTIQPALLLACMFNIPEILNHIRGTQGLDIWEHDPKHHSALQIALENGHSGVIDALREDITKNINKIDVQATRQLYRMLTHPEADRPRVFHYLVPLQAAAAGNSIEQIEMLIESGAHNIHGGYYGDALQAAAAAEHSSVVEYLLSHELHFDPNSAGGYHGYPLHAAAARGNVQIMGQLLDAGAEVNAIGGHYKHALIAAVLSENIEAVRVLLDNGADATVNLPRSGTVLEIAAQMGQKTVVGMLLEASHDDSLGPSRSSKFLIHAAAKQDLEDVARHLIENGADINLKGNESHQNLTPLQLAIRHGHANIIRLLLENGADWKARTDANETTLILATHHKASGNIVRDILEFASTSSHKGKFRDFIDSVKVGSATALHDAAYYGNSEAVGVLLEWRAKIKFDDWKNSPLNLCVSRRHPVALLKKFLEMPAPVKDEIELTSALNVMNNWEYTPMYDAIQFDDTAAATAYLEEGNSIHYEREGLTPLMAAAKKDNAKIVDAILRLSSNSRATNFSPITRNKIGQTATHVAAEAGAFDALTVLLKHECVLDGDSYLVTPLHKASRNKHPRCVRAILELSPEKKEAANFNLDAKNQWDATPLMDAAEKGADKIGRKLLDAGADCMAVSDAGYNLLMYCTWRDFTEFARMILEAASRKEGQVRKLLDTFSPASGRDAFLDAAYHAHMKPMQLLLDYGTDWAARAGSGATALTLCASKNSTETVDLVLKVADQEGNAKKVLDYIAFRNEDGKTALDLADQNKNLQMQTMILRYRDKYATRLEQERTGST